MAKQNLSKSQSTAQQKTIPAALVILEVEDTLKRAENTLQSLDGLMGILAECERAPQYVNLEYVANGFGYMLKAIQGQITSVRERLGQITCDGSGAAIGIEKGSGE